MAADIILKRKKEGRGLFLTAILVIHSLFAAYSLYALTASFHAIILSADASLISYSILIITIISIIFLWKWKKIGVYGLILLLILSISFFGIESPSVVRTINNNGRNALEEIIVNYSPYVLIVFVYFWAIKRKWHLFS